MKRSIPLILDTCAVTAFALWLGGLATCWLVLAPTVRGTPAEVMPAAQRLFVETQHRFSAVVEACGIILVALQWLLRRRYQRAQNLFVADGVRTLLVFVALFCAEYGRYVLVPTLLKTQSLAAYSALAALAIAQSILLIGYAAITGWLQASRLPTVASAAPRSVVTAPTDLRPSKASLPRRQKR